MTERYAVFGNPIKHSKSPQIHQLFAEQTGQDMVYTKELVAEDQFTQAASAFFSEQGKGLNITVPFKLDAYHFAGQLSIRARQAGAVNTLILQSDGSVLGENTDGIGLVRDLKQNLHWLIKGKKVLMLGAGGAVRGVLGPLLKEEPAELCIANRTVEKAQLLAKSFSENGKIHACGFGELQSNVFDLVINGTSASLSQDLPPLPDQLLTTGACCYDMMYGAEKTVFLQWAEQRGAAVADGLGMLVEQATESFFLWRGLQPETAPVIDAIRATLHT